MATLKKTSIYLEEELDQALALRAAEEGISKAEFIRRNLQVAAARPKRPRIAVGAVQQLADDPPHPQDEDAELAAIYERRDRERRERTR